MPVRRRADGGPANYRLRADRRFYARPYSGWLTTFCCQRQTQKLMQCLAERQALADGDPLRVIADRGLEAQPHSAGSR